MSRVWRGLFLLFFFCSLGLEAKKEECRYELALCAIFHNEARFLREWIEFHRIVGVEHFYLYNHGSTDGYRKVLSPYIEQGIVDLLDWSYRVDSVWEWNRVQCAAYNHALRHFGDRVHWLAVIDTDEFLYPVREESLPIWLRSYAPYAAVGVNWQVFGTSGVRKIHSNGSMIEQLVWKSSPHARIHRHVKCIVQPSKCSFFDNPHFAHYLPGEKQVDTSKVSFLGPFSPHVHLGEARINHYWTRDVEFVLKEKVRRRRSWGDKREVQEILNMHHAEQDFTIHRFLKRLKEVL